MGAPGNNRIYIIKSQHYHNLCTSDFSNPGTYVDINGIFNPGTGPQPIAWQINASSIASLSGVTVEDGWGANILSFGKMGEMVDDFLYVANTNMRLETSEETPQFMIFRIDRAFPPALATSDFALEVAKTGEAGTMLGGYVRLLGGHASNGDITGDGVPEVAIAHPKGQTSYGATGLVKIYSGQQLVNLGGNDPINAVLQTIFNPEAAFSNFGVFMDYTDVNGDDIPDFLIGADKYNTSNYTEAGALYIIPVEPAD